MTKPYRLPMLARRPFDSHKGMYGHVLVVGGSRGMIGAPALATNAALRAGAGLLTVAAPEPVQLFVATLCPCATSVPLACDSQGELAAQAVRQLAEEMKSCDVLAIGPGMGTSSGAQSLVRAALEQDKPTVIDADGLNCLAKIDNWPALRRCAVVLTPHPGEFGRLTGMTANDVQDDRQGHALAAVRQWASAGPADKRLVLVLKGGHTIVTDGRRVYINKVSSPGLATGGTGDVLTGMVAGLLGQHLAPFDAACLAVHTHGLAGVLAAKAKGEVSMIATDLLDFLPEAFKRQVKD